MRKPLLLEAPRDGKIEKESDFPATLEARALIENRRIEEAKWRHFDAARVEFWNCDLLGCVCGPGQGEKWQLTDVRWDECDLSNFAGHEMDVRRGEFIGSKMVGFAANESHFCDVVFRNCVLLHAQLRCGRFERVRFDDCVLRGADFSQSDLRGIIFAGCDLRESDFSGAQLRGADIRGSQVEGLRLSIEAAQGLIIEPMQAAFLATNMGLDVRWNPN